MMVMSSFGPMKKFCNWCRSGIFIVNFEQVNAGWDDIPTKMIKLNKDIIAPFISKNFNFCVDKVEFLNHLKHMDIVPVHKKKSKIDKTNYYPVRILLNLSKLLEKLMYKQMCLVFRVLNIAF